MEAEHKSENQQNWLGRFLIIWTGQAFSILGSRLVSFALIWWLTRETGSAVVLATATTMVYLPQIFLGPFVGALVDRWNRRLVIILSDTAVALATLFLAFLFWSDVVQIWHIYVLIFFRTLGGAFHFPAMQASMSLLVPEKHYTRVAGLNQILGGSVNVLGPALGALLMEAIPVQGVLAIDVVTAAIAVGPLLFIAIPQPFSREPVQRVTPSVVWKDVKEGFRYVMDWKGLMIMLSFEMVLNFMFAPMDSFMPLLVTEHFQGGVWHLGALESIFGIGMIVGGVLMSAWGGFQRKIYNMLVGLLVMGIGAVLIGAAPKNGFWLAAAASFVLSVSNTVMNGSILALMQAVIQADMQGRMFSLMSSLSSAIAPLGLLVAAPVVEKISIQFWFIFSGVLCIVLASASPWIPALINIETQMPTWAQTRATEPNGFLSEGKG